jgi:hypothetical protein
MSCQQNDCRNHAEEQKVDELWPISYLHVVHM